MADSGSYSGKMLDAFGNAKKPHTLILNNPLKNIVEIRALMCMSHTKRTNLTPRLAISHHAQRSV